MSLTLKLYLTNDSDNVINKTLLETEAVALRLGKDFDLLRPTFLLVEPEGVNFINYNYCTLPSLNMCYFIRSLEMVNNKVYRLVCECDVLETYKTDILTSVCLHRKQPASGDYGEVSIESTGRTVVTNYYSDVELTPNNTNILSVIGVNQGLSDG